MLNPFPDSQGFIPIETDFTNSNNVDFYRAASRGDGTALIEYLKQPNFNVNSPDPDGDTALYYAASMQNHNTVRILLNSGANPNIAGKGGTPLRIASYVGNFEIVEMLLEKGAHIDGDNQNTPMCAAILQGHYRLAAYLLSKGANPNQPSGPWNETPLMGASQEGSYQLVKDLLAYGANVNARDKDGDTAIVYATMGSFPLGYNKKVIIELLLHGASYDELKSRGISLGRSWTDDRCRICYEEISSYEITEEMLYDPQVCIREDTQSSKGPNIHMNYVPGRRSR